MPISRPKSNRPDLTSKENKTSLIKTPPPPLFYPSITTKQILLPLDPHHDFSRFVLHVNEQTDTLRVIHTTESYLISYTCGFGSLFTLDNVSYSNLMIQNLEIINSVIDAELEQNEEHLWIYF
jgi:hypothetical protein